jgi:hypothetical protein
MSPESIQQMTSGALAALHDLDPSTATQIVEKFLQHASDYPVAMNNLYASGLLGQPGQLWDIDIRDRVDSFMDFVWNNSNSSYDELSSTCRMLFGDWLKVVQPLPEDLSYLLFRVDSSATALREYFLDAGADPNLPIRVDLRGQKETKEAFSAWQIVFGGAMTPWAEELLAKPADDLPLIIKGAETDACNDRTMLDVALVNKRSEALEAILRERDITAPNISKRLSDSVELAIATENGRWLLRLIGVGAEPADKSWESVISFFTNHGPDESAPRLLISFREEADEAGSLHWKGRPAAATAVERLVAHGLDVDLVDEEGHGMVFLASHYGCFKVLDTLLNLGAEYRDVLAGYDVDRPRFTNFAAEEHAKHMLLAHAARDAMSGIVKQAKPNTGEEP